jgi:hypothetical protein
MPTNIVTTVSQIIFSEDETLKKPLEENNGSK